MRERTLIMVSGFAATGKSTLCRLIGEDLKLRVYSGGEALLLAAKRFGYNPRGLEWWDTKEGLEFLERRKLDNSIDRSVDEELKKIASRESAVIDSWVLPWLVDEGYKIWLKADLEARAERLIKRSKLDLETAVTTIRERDEVNRQLYYSLYKIRLGEDFSPFHLVLDTSRLETMSVFRIVRTAIHEQFNL
ncbi:MAG: cytidylate kinase family protein [Aigarchaeota archaeon]|nr:cytidylate kinase family protein [Aigarchaeota archaeon]MDW8092926.1 cytidylate kinase family protein [Nitrososphaerota archaeon]